MVLYLSVFYGIFTYKHQKETCMCELTLLKLFFFNFCFNERVFPNLQYWWTSCCSLSFSQVATSSSSDMSENTGSYGRWAAAVPLVSASANVEYHKLLGLNKVGVSNKISWRVYKMRAHCWPSRYPPTHTGVVRKRTL